MVPPRSLDTNTPLHVATASICRDCRNNSVSTRRRLIASDRALVVDVRSLEFDPVAGSHSSHTRMLGEAPGLRQHSRGFHGVCGRRKPPLICRAWKSLKRKRFSELVDRHSGFSEPWSTRVRARKTHDYDMRITHTSTAHKNTNTAHKMGHRLSAGARGPQRAF